MLHVLTKYEVKDDLSATQILREISFGNFEVLKTAILTIPLALTFDFVEFFAFVSLNFY